MRFEHFDVYQAVKKKKRIDKEPHEGYLAPFPSLSLRIKKPTRINKSFARSEQSCMQA